MMSNFKSKHQTGDNERPAPKRVRLAEPNDDEPANITKEKRAESKTFAGVPEIQAALGVNGGKLSTGLIETLSTLRNQFSLRHTELQTLILNSQSTSTSNKNTGSYLNALPSVLQTTDPRLLLLEKWCSSSPGLEELFAVWDGASALSSTGWSKPGTGTQGQAQGPAAMSSTITSLTLNLLTSILSLLSSYYTFHPHAHPILKNLFSNERWRKLCGYIAGRGGSSSNELILVTLRLLSVVVERWDAKKVLEGFVWESKSLSKLSHMRRKGSSSQANPLVKPDIRTAYMLFLLSFLLPSTSAGSSSSGSPSSNSQTKTAFLQQHAFHFTSLFKNLHQDHPALVRRVLEVSWEGVWCDVRVSRSLKVGVFAGSGAGGVLQNLLKLYERSTVEDAEDEESGIGEYTVADLVHHFLLAICTRPGVGLCFRDRGWYPRDVGGDDDDEEEEDSKNASEKPKKKLYNPTLLSLLRNLRPTDDPRQNELAIKILHVCPELVSAYLPVSGLTLDPPRLSSKWVGNLSFFANVIGGGAVPESTFFLSEGVYKPTPPPLTTIVNNVVPGGGVNRLNMRNVFTKGLQFVASKAVGASPGNLVQHTTALALIRCLEKLGRVREAMEGVAKELGEGEGRGMWQRVGELGEDEAAEDDKEGLWTGRLKEVVKEARRRFPEFQVVLAFCTAHLKTSTPGLAGTTPAADQSAVVVSEGEQIKKALLAECAMRLLWMYQEALPEVVEEARFDVGKVLVGFEAGLGPETDTSESEDEKEEEGREDEGDEEKDEEDEQAQGQAPQELSTHTRLQRLTQLHILRFLRASPSFSFTAPSPSYPGHTHLYSLLIGVVKLGGIASDGRNDRLEAGISDELRKLVKHVLGKSIVFQWTKDGLSSCKDEEEEGEVDVWLSCLPVGLRRVREVKRLVDVNEDEDVDSQGKTVTVYPETLDGTQLTDERISVVNFLEECTLRCAKTPYKYIEDLEKMAANGGAAELHASGATGGSLPSPLIVTLVEQLEAKLLSQGAAASAPSSSALLLLTPSDVLAITLYMRLLAFALVGKLEVGSLLDPNRLFVLQQVLDHLEGLFSGDAWEKAFGGEPHAIVRSAVEREVRIARRCLGLSGAGEQDVDVEEDKDVDDFLDLVEALEISSPNERRLTVYELIDWVRLLGVPLNQAQMIRLWGAVKETWADGLAEVLKYLDVPDIRVAERGASVWEALLKPELSPDTRAGADAIEVDAEDDEAVNEGGDEDEGGDESGSEDAEEEDEPQFDPRSLPFEYLLAHALPQHLLDSVCQDVLTDAALSHCGYTSLHPSSSLSISVLSSTASSVTTAQKVQYVIRHILHRFSVFLAIERPDAAGALLSILASPLEKVKILDPVAFRAVKAIVVAGLKEYMSVSTNSILKTEAIGVVREGLLRVQEAVLDAMQVEDRALVVEVAGAWVEVLKGQLAGAEGDSDDASYAGWWIQFIQPEEVLQLLGEIVEGPTLALIQGESTTKQVAAVSDIVERCLNTLKNASRHPEQYGHLSNQPRNLNLLFKLHALLSPSSTEELGSRPGVKTVEELIAIMLEEGGVPMALGGQSSDLISESGLSKAIESADARFSTLRTGITLRVCQPDLLNSVQSFLSQPLAHWTDSTEKIVRNFLYRKGAGHDSALEKQILEWLASRERLEKGEARERVVGVVHALLDCVLERKEASPLHEEVGLKIFKFLLHRIAGPDQRRSQAKDSIQTLVKILSRSKSEGDALHGYFKVFEYRLKSLQKSISITPELITFSQWSMDYLALAGSKSLERAQSVGGDVAELGMQWLIRRLGEEEGQKELDHETSAICTELSRLVKRDGVPCKAATLETLIGVVVQSHYHIAKPECLEVIEVGLAKAALKPLVVNRCLQSIIQHPHFFKLCTAPSSPPTDSLARIRESITCALKALFFLHPANTCQVSHIEPLIRIYGATLSTSDRTILSVFKLFERQRKLSVRSIVGRWAPPSSSLANAAGSGTGVGLEALQNLDTILVLKTALSFPVRRTMDGDDAEASEKITSAHRAVPGHEAQLYDPLFLLFLLQHVLANGPPTSAISWIELFRSNVVGLALRALSAREGKVREVGMACVLGVWTLMQNADLQEREHVLYLLGLLKNALTPPTSGSSMRMDVDEDEAKLPPRLPSYTTLLLFHALRGIFNPSTFVYPLTSRFLLQRAELDITDVPMLYSMLYSSDSDDWKKERGWIIRFLADGILTGSAVVDWRVLKRRHVWDLVASMYQGAGATLTATTGSGANDGGMGVAAGDRALKLGILDFLANVTGHRSPTMSLVLKSGLLAWIEMQLTGPDRHAGYGVEWLRILENVLVVVDVKKIEASALKGQWLRVVGRCVEGILKESMGSPSMMMSIFPLSVRLIVRLSLAASVGERTLSTLLNQGLAALKVFEAGLKRSPVLSSATAVPDFDEMVSPARHSSHVLHDKLVFSEETHIFVWGRSVESLWRATMNLDLGKNTSSSDVWNSLTSRLLVWRGLVGANSSPVGEWARAECVRNMGL